MADTDENKEGVEPEEKEQAAPAKKVAKKKVAKKKTAKKKVAKKKAAKKKAAPAKESVVVEEKPEETPAAQVETPAPAEPVVSQAATQVGAVDAEQEKNQLIGLWVLIAVVCMLLIGALSPSGEKPATAPASVSHESSSPKVQLQEAAPTQQSVSAEKAPEKQVAEEKGASIPVEGGRPPKRPEGSPPGYWQLEAGAWHYMPYAQEEVPAPAASATVPSAPAPEQDKAPPATPADAPPGYWKYKSGKWEYEPYHQEQEKPAPSDNNLTAS